MTPLERRLLELLRDARARVTRAGEALEDGDDELARLVLDDLGADLWRALEEAERRA